MLNVFDTELLRVVEIDVSKLNPSKHFHCNTRTAFSADDLTAFGYSEAPVTLVAPVVESVVETSIESMTKAELVEYALTKGIELDPTMLKADMIATLTV